MLLDRGSRNHVPYSYSHSAVRGNPADSYNPVSAIARPSFDRGGNSCEAKNRVGTSVDSPYERSMPSSAIEPTRSLDIISKILFGAVQFVLYLTTAFEPTSLPKFYSHGSLAQR